MKTQSRMRAPNQSTCFLGIYGSVHDFSISMFFAITLAPATQVIRDIQNCKIFNNSTQTEENRKGVKLLPFAMRYHTARGRDRVKLHPALIFTCTRRGIPKVNASQHKCLPTLGRIPLSNTSAIRRHRTVPVSENAFVSNKSIPCFSLWSNPVQRRRVGSQMQMLRFRIDIEHSGLWIQQLQSSREYIRLL